MIAFPAGTKVWITGGVTDKGVMSVGCRWRISASISACSLTFATAGLRPFQIAGHRNREEVLYTRLLNLIADLGYDARLGLNTNPSVFPRAHSVGSLK